VKHKDLRPWLSVIAGGESLVSHAGGVLLVETARRSGLSEQLRRLLGRWRLPLAIHDPGKIVTDLAIAVALGGDAACDVAVLRAQPGVFGPVASDPTVSRLITRLAVDADDVLTAISAARAGARERVWHHAGAPVQDGRVVPVHVGTPFEARAPDPVSGQLSGPTTWRSGHIRSRVSCRLSPTGIRFLDILFPPKISALLTVGLPETVMQTGRTLSGFPCSARMRHGRDGCLLYPGAAVSSRSAQPL
jgi:Transposase DDE domain group 1